MTTHIVMGGAAGRMGRMILSGAAEDANYEIVGATEFEGSPALGKTVGQLIGRPEIAAPVVADLASIEAPCDAVVIHFSSPEATLAQLEWSIARGSGVVIGTTGLDEAQRQTVASAAEKVPVVFAPNMSVGVNTLFKIAGEVARILGEAYDIEIVEMHHRFKKDAPSGTARRLGEVVAEARGTTYEEAIVNGREGMTGERCAGEIGMHALRGGDVVGDHTVTFATLGERVELSHRAHSRETFARGALRAAAWVVGREPGLYDMQDVLGLR